MMRRGKEEGKEGGVLVVGRDSLFPKSIEGRPRGGGGAFVFAQLHLSLLHPTLHLYRNMVSLVLR